MKIAFITPEFVTEPSYSGGLANYLGRITVALVEQGHTVHVFTRSQKNEELQFKGVTLHRVVPLWDTRMILDHIDPLIPRKLYNPYQDLKAAWCLWQRWLRVHKNMKFDVVQVANVMAVGLFFQFTNNVPVVTRMSSYRPFWDTAAGIEQNAGVKLRWWMEEVAVKGIKNIYAPTYFVANQVQKGYGITKVDVLETPFFLEETKLDLTAFEKYAQRKSYLLFFGRMTQMKGVHILAKALPELLQEFPDMEAFFIGGHGPAPDGKPMPEYIRSELQKFVDRTHILESMPHDQLYPFIQKARIVVLPSLMDNLPNTCLEAMGLGKVIVATTGSCFEQVIENNVSGFLVPPGDVEALKKAIGNAWQLHEKEEQVFAQKAIASVNRLHPDQAIPKLINYYQSVINQ